MLIRRFKKAKSYKYFLHYCFFIPAILKYLKAKE